MRRVQGVSSNPGSVAVILPKTFCTELGIAQGDYVKIHVEGKTLVVEKGK
jgi:antitoxin component of MazEF toxin-antitoxin module